jgi:hypothetical protein
MSKIAYIDLTLYLGIAASSYVAGNSEGGLKWWAGLFVAVFVAAKAKLSPGREEKKDEAV